MRYIFKHGTVAVHTRVWGCVQMWYFLVSLRNVSLTGICIYIYSSQCPKSNGLAMPSVFICYCASRNGVEDSDALSKSAWWSFPPTRTEKGTIPQPVYQVVSHCHWKPVPQLGWVQVVAEACCFCYLLSWKSRALGGWDRFLHGT